MTTVNIHEAKTHLSRLLERVAQGESFIIAKAGHPVARVVPMDKVEKPPPHAPRRLGFMPYQEIPEDFDEMGREEIEKMFYGEEE
ncbi:MAG: type II toxin-antitoxin system Phd/YefM family antitoxin [Bryobacteraceae bacterium]|nr:type II toxin-antitoxin system Phd/YefM family antitoxin [Bryobacteraceae bacterium]